jgi:hypothetical protein
MCITFQIEQPTQFTCGQAIVIGFENSAIHKRFMIVTYKALIDKVCIFEVW